MKKQIYTQKMQGVKARPREAEAQVRSDWGFGDMGSLYSVSQGCGGWSFYLGLGQINDNSPFLKYNRLGTFCICVPLSLSRRGYCQTTSETRFALFPSAVPHCR